MPNFTRGSLQFEHAEVGRFDAPVEAVEQWSCEPPPAGSRTRFAPADEHPPLVVRHSLQPREVERMEEGAKKQREPELRFSALLPEIYEAFGWETANIALRSVPEEWQSVVPCFRATIFVEVLRIEYEVTARTTRQVNVGGVPHAKDDLVAAFRVAVPAGEYRWVRMLEFEPRCCPDREPARTRVERSAIRPTLEGIEFFFGEPGDGIPPGDWDGDGFEGPRHRPGGGGAGGG